MADDRREYLGDSVYASTEEGMVRLCTNNGDVDENVILLEPEVAQALVEYIARAVKEGER